MKMPKKTFGILVRNVKFIVTKRKKVSGKDPKTNHKKT
jgi:hypothetical protein